MEGHLWWIELEEKPGEGLNLQQYVDVIRRRHMYFLIPFFRRVASGLERELGSAFTLQVGNSDFGRAAEHAKGLRDAEHNR